MKRPILPMVCIGLVSAGLANSQELSQAQAPSQQQQERVQLRTQTTEVEQRDSSRFELRQQPTRASTEAATSTPVPPRHKHVETSAEAAAIGDNAQVISLRETPGPVRRHIERQAAFVPLQRIVKQMHGDKAVYEATFDGATLQTKLLLAEDGKPMNLHLASASPVVYEAAGSQRPTNRQSNQMPRATMDRLRQQIGNAQIQSIQPRTIYEVQLQQNGQAQQIWVYEDGSILR